MAARLRASIPYRQAQPNDSVKEIFEKKIGKTDKVRSRYSEQAETYLCATVTLHVREWEKLKRLRVLLIRISLCFALLGRFRARIVL